MNLKPYIIAVNAISGGGKTTVTKALLNRLQDAAALYFDDRDYDTKSGIDDICKWVDEGSDANKFNLDLLINDIEKLMKQDVYYILLDYPFGYRHKKIAPYIDLSVFIDTPLDIALSRRLIRDYKMASVQNVVEDLAFYLNRGRATYLSSRQISMENSDIIIDGSQSLDKIMDDIICAIQERKTLGQI